MNTGDDPRPDPLVLYDVELVLVDHGEHTLTFLHNSCELLLRTAHVSTWAAGSVGRLTLHSSGEVRFLVYPDPRLRRAPELDQPSVAQWGWRLGDYRLRVRAGVIPGANGAVIVRDVERLQLEIPREFVKLCAASGVTPEFALRAFIADVCALQNLFMYPREDGYSSLGSDERLYAKAYWLRAYAPFAE